MDNEENNSLVIVLQHQGRRLSDRRKSLVKAHVAKRVHHRRRQNAKAEKPHAGDAIKANPHTIGTFDDWQSSRQSSTNPSSPEASQSPSSSIPDSSPGASPRSILSKGNADPFATTVVVVDPIVNQLITFYRESHVPLQHWRRVDASRRSSYATTFFQHIVNALKDGCTGYAYLAGYASMLSNITQDPAMATTALDFRSRAYTKLHARLSNDWDAPTSLAWTLYAFFTSAINAHDFVAAEIHGRALRGILQPGTKTGPVRWDERLLHSLLWQENQRAALTLTRPLFDLRWMTMILVAGPFFKFVWRNVRVRSTQEKVALDESIARIFCETSYLLRLTDGHTAGHVQLAKAAIRKIAARSLVLEGQLLILYCDRTEKLSSEAGSMPSTHREICVVLAGLYWLRRAGHHEGFRAKSMTPQPRRNVYDAGSKIHTRIKEAMVEAGAKEMLSDPTMLLWILYVGSVIEHGLDVPADDDSMWFNRLFVVQAKRMGLIHWSAVEAALKEVLYRPELGPHARWSFEYFAKASSGQPLSDDYINAEAFQVPDENEGESQSPGGSIYSAYSDLEEDRISTDFHDSIYGLFE